MNNLLNKFKCYSYRELKEYSQKEFGENFPVDSDCCRSAGEVWRVAGGRTSIVTLGSGQDLRLEGHLAKNENFERKNLLGEN